MSRVLHIDLRRFERHDLATFSPWLEAAGLGVPDGACHKVWGERLRADPGIVCRVATSGDGVAGLFRLDLAPDRSAELTILVAPALRRRGFGRALLGRAIEQARHSGLSQVVAAVRLDNGAGLAFFQSAGFVESRPRVPGYRYLECEVGAARRLEEVP